MQHLLQDAGPNPDDQADADERGEPCNDLQRDDDEDDRKCQQPDHEREELGHVETCSVVSRRDPAQHRGERRAGGGPENRHRDERGHLWRKGAREGNRPAEPQQQQDHGHRAPSPPALDVMSLLR